MTKLYFFDSLQKLPGTPLGSFFFKMLFVSECENKIYHRRDVIHSLRRMIYLLRKYDIISVPSYAGGIYHPPKADIIPKVYHPFRKERISLKKT